MMKKLASVILILMLSVAMTALSQDGGDDKKDEKKRVRLAKEMLAKTAVAIGGVNQFEGINTIHVKGRRDVVDPARDMNERFEFWMDLRDSSFYVQLYYGEGEIIESRLWISCYNGDYAWAQNPFSNEGKPLKIRRSDQNFIPEIMEFLRPVIYEYEANNIKVKFEDEYELKNGNDYNKIRATFEDYTQEDFYFDVETNKLYKREKRTKNYLNRAVEQELFFDHWQTVEGKTLPKQARQVHDGETKIVYHFDEFEFNVELDRKMFEMPKVESEEENNAEEGNKNSGK